MYNLFKYFDILQLESTYEKEFDNINPNKKIAILPPVLKKYFGKTVLAYLVMSQPESQDHHYGVTRPIGAILRSIKSKRVMKVISCAQSEFAPDKNDFAREYYDLEDHEDWWPNRTPENEETYRICLEKMFKVCKTLNIFGKYKQSYYDDYLATVQKLFNDEYWYFFLALQDNPITPLDDEIMYQRDLAKKEHEVRALKRQEKQKAESESLRQLFIKDIKENMKSFIIKEIAPTIKNKADYCKVDFYEFIGKMIKDLYIHPEGYIGCYNAALTSKALTTNQESLKETFKVNMIKTYAKACVKPMAEDEHVNNISEKILVLLNAMLQQEKTGEVTEKSKEIVNNCMKYISDNLYKVSNTTCKQELQEIYDGLVKDYYETTDAEQLSNIYIGYFLSNDKFEENATTTKQIDGEE